MDRVVIAEPDRWNHNIHYHPRLLAAVPPDARDALDVGCGEGMLVRRLSERVPRVVGIDTDPASIAAALTAAPADGTQFVLGDVLTYPFEPRSFDLITSVATLHHLDAAVALARLAELLRPGGRLAVLGCARAAGPADLPWEVGGLLAHRLLRRRRQVWDHPSPTVWPPPLTYRQMRRLAVDALPGATFHRHLLWRYSLVWTKP